MIRPVLVLTGVTALLAALDLALVRRAAREASAEGRAGALLSRERAEEVRRQPFLRVRVSGETHRYGRVEGRWRCLSAFDAPADGRAIGALLDALAGAEGFVVGTGTEAAPRFGINAPETIEIAVEGPRALQSPGGDPLATFDVGAAVPGRAEGFVRLRGTPEIWSIGTDLRALLEPAAPGLPPLLPSGAVPDDWRSAAEGLASLARLDDGVEVWRLVRTAVAIDPEHPPAGGRPWTWVLERGGIATPCDDERAEALAQLVETLPYVGLLDPARRATLAPGRPARTLVLTGRTGNRIALELRAPLDDGRVPLDVGDEGPLRLLAPEVAEGLVPGADTLVKAPEGAEVPR